MSHKEISEAFGHRLLQQGLKLSTARRMAGEFIDHLHELETEARESGMKPEEAEAYARESWGDWKTTADQWGRAHRERTWWGRHPKWVFGGAPLVLFILAYVVGGNLLGVIGHSLGWWDALKDGSAGHLNQGLALLAGSYHFLLMLGLPTLFLHLARRSGLPWHWPLLACLILSVHAMLNHVDITWPQPGIQGSFAWGYGFRLNITSQFWAMLPPWFVLGLGYHFYYRRDWKTPFTANYG